MNIQQKGENSSEEITLNHTVRFLMGRPLWGATILVHSNENELQSYQALLSCATIKLLKREDLDNVKPEIWEHIAKLGVLTWSCISLEHQKDAMLAQKLVESYMATCCFISEDRKKIHSTYLSEPILAEAACVVNYHLICKGVAYARYQTDSILRSKQSTDVGDLGEVFGALLLLFVNNNLRFGKNFQKATKLRCDLLLKWNITNNAFFVVALKDLLKAFSCPVDQFVNSCTEEHKEIKAMLETGKLMFNHYISVTKKVLTDERKILLKCFERGCALRLINNFTGADLLLPVCFTNTKQEIKFGALLVQIKCYSTKIVDNAVFGRKLAPSFVFPPQLKSTTSIGLVLPLGTGDWAINEKKCFVNNKGTDILKYEHRPELLKAVNDALSNNNLQKNNKRCKTKQDILNVIKTEPKAKEAINKLVTRPFVNFSPQRNRLEELVTKFFGDNALQDINFAIQKDVEYAKHIMPINGANTTCSVSYIQEETINSNSNSNSNNNSK